MSRHVIVHNERREVVVGWDNPLGTFFGQEFEAFGEEELLWCIGTIPHEVKSLPELESALRSQGWDLPPDVAAQLAADKAEPWEPGPLQKLFGFTG